MKTFREFVEFTYYDEFKYIIESFSSVTDGKKEFENHREQYHKDSAKASGKEYRDRSYKHHPHLINANHSMDATPVQKNMHKA